MADSREVHRENQRAALKLMVKDLGPEWLSDGIFTVLGPPYDQVDPATWSELTTAGYLEAVKRLYAPTEFKLTVKGWLTGMQLLGVPDTPAFQENLQKLLQVLRDKFLGSERTVCESIQNIARQSGLPMGFIRNAIDADLLGLYLKQPQVTWDSPKSRGSMIRIPGSFVMPPATPPTPCVARTSGKTSAPTQ
jgi:hypothetical protein